MREGMFMELSKKIKALRNSQNMTQKQLASLCGISEPAIRNYELGNRTPSEKIMKILAKALNIDYAVLLTSLLSDRLNLILINLPCEVGSTVYMIGGVKSGSHIISGQVDHFTIGGLGVPLADICTDNNDWYIACSYPNDYFLTREEAQETLKKNGGT